MSRFRNCDGISASRKVSKSAFVNSGATLCRGVVIAETFAGGGDGSGISGDGAGPCPWAPAISAEVSVANNWYRRMALRIENECASCKEPDKNVIYSAPFPARRV
jgi:hypothetical protein